MLNFLPSSESDSYPQMLQRIIRTSVSSELYRSFLSPGLPEVIKLGLTRGFGVRSIHSIQAANNPNRLALVDKHRSMTYEQVDCEINQIANALRQEYGVGEGDPVMMMMENRAEYVMTWFALFRLGSAAVHASYRMTPDELEYQVEHSGSQIIFVSEKSYEAAREIQERHPEYRLKLIMVDENEDTDSIRDYDSFIRKSSQSYPGNATKDTPGNNVVYTSGTTGKPKGTVRDMNAQVGLNELFRILDALPVKDGDRHLIVAPIYHSGGQAFTLMQTALGATIFLRPKFEAEDTLKMLDRWNINSIYMVPTMIRRVLNLSSDLHDQYPANSLRCLVSTAAPFPQPLRERAIERFGPDTINDAYGATELGLITHINGREMLEKPTSSGKPLPGQEIKVMDDSGNELPRGEVGTIYVRNEQTMSGYLKNEEANEEIKSGEWMTVEDLGYLDEDGYLYLTGRSRDMVITGGVNVYPVEVEQTLERFDNLKEAAVFGIPDEEWGEKLVAVVVPDEGESVDTDKLEEFAQDHLHRAKVPKNWKTLQELPRTHTGKVLKRKLQDSFDLLDDKSYLETDDADAESVEEESAQTATAQ